MEAPLLLEEENQVLREEEETAAAFSPPIEKSSISTTSFNILNNMVGSGLLSIPWCMKQLDAKYKKDGSSLHGNIVLAFVALICFTSFSLVGVVCERHKDGISSFDELAAVAGMPKRVVNAVLAIYTWLSCLSFVLLTCDFFAADDTGLVYFVEDRIANNAFVRAFEHRMVIVLLLVATVLFPFSRFKDLSSLKNISILSILAMFFMVAVSIRKYILDKDVDRAPDADDPPVGVLQGLFLAHPIFLISFTAHYNAPRLYAELEHASANRFALATGIAVAGAFTIYSSFGSLSYATFRAETASNVLTNYSASSLLAVFSRIAMCIVVLTTYPLAYQAMKTCMFRAPSAVPWWMDAALVLSTALPAAVLTDIGILLDYKGSVLGGIVSLLIPCMAFARLVKSEAAASSHYHSKRYWGAILLSAWAIACSLGGFITTSKHL